MKSIILKSQTPSVRIVPQSDLKPHLNSTKLLWLSNCSKSTAGYGFLHIHGQNRRDSFLTRVSSTTLLLAATSPPNSGDFSVVFQTSAVMLLVYWVANFLVPELVLKDLQADKSNEERKQDEENLSDDRQGRSSGQKKGRL